MTALGWGLNVGSKRATQTSTRQASRFSVITETAARQTSRLIVDNIVHSPLPDVPLGPYKPLCDFVTEDWNTFGERLAIVNGTTEETRTFTELSAGIDAFAVSLVDMGVKKGDVVAVLSPNDVDYIACCLAVVKIGAITSCANPLSTSDEFTKLIESSGAKVIVTHPQCLEVASTVARARASQVENVIVFGDAAPTGAVSFNSIRSSGLALSSPVCDILPGDCCALPYSSGTTGMPKGVMLTHDNICVNLWQTDICETRFMGPHGSSTLISPLPMFHIYGFTTSMLSYAWRGHTIVTMTRYDIKRFCELVEKYQPTRGHLVPPICLGLANDPITTQYDMSSLSMVVTAAAPMSPEVQEACKTKIGFDIKQAWGMSELSPLGTCVVDDAPGPAGNIGPVLSNTLGKVIDLETGEALGPGEEGELCIKGPQVMKGYWKNEEETSKCLDSEGWLKTGDIAKFDEDGYFFITDRLKELIKYNGFQVPPAEIEGVLVTHPKLADAAVIPVTDPSAGELPRAYVVVAADALGDPPSEKDVTDYVASKVAPHKKLRGGVRFVDAIPKNAAGKILRKVVRAMDAESEAALDK
eukprot:CAMPEP_0185748694 /NCGR_PEP_ID=MMETSP1174-20130828/7404_1 /TAXON_ID=35687 /ORGANISM="Dictyocha speculum, Strain CCMP1381" /LENGTH=583 /DNA_ID=CAMNT_0028424497 /DNA_START=36 /DNA_END=1787 /DNA_ORIENTATION=-